MSNHAQQPAQAVGRAAVDHRSFPQRSQAMRRYHEAHTPQRYLRIRDLLPKMRHDGCGGSLAALRGLRIEQVL